MMRRPLRPALRLATMLVLLSGTAGCAAVRGGESEQREAATVEVDNQIFSDVRVYAIRNTERVRLGMVPALSTRVLNVPAHFTFGTPVRFVAEPMASNARPTSQDIAVHPGDRLRLVVRP
jgi:hypothetical protein